MRNDDPCIITWVHYYENLPSMKEALAWFSKAKTTLDRIGYVFTRCKSNRVAGKDNSAQHYSLTIEGCDVLPESWKGNGAGMEETVAQLHVDNHSRDKKLKSLLFARKNKFDYRF